MPPDKTGKKQASPAARSASTRFQPGQSGNPAGRPAGARNKTAVLALDIFDGDAEAIFRKLVAEAKAGRPIALKLVMERLVPRRGRVIELTDMPSIERASDIAQACASVIAHAAHGDLTLEEAERFMALLGAQRLALETQELAVRIESLEQQARDKSGRYRLDRNGE